MNLVFQKYTSELKEMCQKRLEQGGSRNLIFADMAGRQVVSYINYVMVNKETPTKKSKQFQQFIG